METKLVIPETVAEMQEIMNTPAKAAEWIQAGQFAEIVDAYREKTTPEFAEQVPDQLKAFFDSTNVIADKAKEAVRDVLREHGVNQSVNRPIIPDPGTGAVGNAAYNPLAPGVPMNDIGFANIGDFARTVWHKNPRPDEERLNKTRHIMDAYSSVDPSAGGFLIPETMRSEIMEVALETSIIRQRATVITMTSLTQGIPYVDSTTNVGSVCGGMVFYWKTEGADLTVKEAKFGRVKLEANALTGLAAVPNALWADAPALSTWLMQALPKGLSFYGDLAFIEGTGAGEPLGFLNSPAIIAVDKQDDQPAYTILVENVLDMFAWMLPSSMSNAIWIANQSTFRQLMTLSISVGVGGAPVALVDIRSGPLVTMLGRPLIISEKVPALGDQGDLCFIDPAYYLIGDRQAVSIETSEHRYFESDQTALRVISRVDGRPWIQSEFTPAHGDTVSPYVVIEARA